MLIPVNPNFSVDALFSTESIRNAAAAFGVKFLTHMEQSIPDMLVSEHKLEASSSILSGDTMTTIIFSPEAFSKIPGYVVDLNAPVKLSIMRNMATSFQQYIVPGGRYIYVPSFLTPTKTTYTEDLPVGSLPTGVSGSGLYFTFGYSDLIECDKETTLHSDIFCGPDVPSVENCLQNKSLSLNTIKKLSSLPVQYDDVEGGLSTIECECLSEKEALTRRIFTILGAEETEITVTPLILLVK